MPCLFCHLRGHEYQASSYSASQRDLPNTNLEAQAMAAYVTLASLLLVAGAMRSEQELASSHWSPWNLSYEGLQCRQIDTSPFPALHDKWPACVKEAIQKGLKLGDEGNCRLCDVEFTGSKPEAELTMTSTKCKATVTCTAARSGPNEKTCFKGHGKLAAVDKLNNKGGRLGMTKYWETHKDHACLPCPEACKSCHAEGKFSTSKSSFKCVLAGVEFQGSGEQKGTMCSDKPKDYDCGECELRNSKQGWQWGSSLRDFKSSCKFPTTYMQVEEAQQPAEDYVLTMRAGEDKAALPPVSELFMK
eukprot:TRINITY_DN23130_c0_g2_i1.p1 TRINITY_DN23130_c0_g2~~TRINITY_DN23130_c0_g2_i1.p1  ORF type:complete len:303 (+),score=45.80 TRINITY_DN23130_c0_g2_i1:74-982(+)